MYLWIMKTDFEGKKAGEVVAETGLDEWNHCLASICYCLDIGFNDPAFIDIELHDFPDPPTYKVNATRQLQCEANEKIDLLYREMNSAVLDAMTKTFGTTKSDSAIAFERTWSDMIANPNVYSLLKLETDIKFAEFEIGDKLDTEAKVISYAKKKLEKVHFYGAFRLKKIQEFRKAKKQILEEYGL